MFGVDFAASVGDFGFFLRRILADVSCGSPLGDGFAVDFAHLLVDGGGSVSVEGFLDRVDVVWACFYG